MKKAQKIVCPLCLKKLRDNYPSFFESFAKVTCSHCSRKISIPTKAGIIMKWGIAIFLIFYVFSMVSADIDNYNSIKFEFTFDDTPWFATWGLILLNYFVPSMFLFLTLSLIRKSHKSARALIYAENMFDHIQMHNKNKKNEK